MGKPTQLDQGNDHPWMDSLLAALPDGIAFVDGKSRIIWANDEFRQLLFLEGKGVGVSLVDCLPEWKLLEGGIVYTLKEERKVRTQRLITFVEPGGKHRTYDLSVARARSATGAKLVLHLKDITEVAELRQKLEDREKSYSFLRGHTTDLIIRTDAKMCITWCNERASQLFSLGQSIQHFLNRESTDTVGTFLVAAQEDKERREVILSSSPDLPEPFYLKGTVRRLYNEEEEFVGLSMILSDDTDNQRFAMLSRQLGLSDREREVIEYLLQGYSNLNIATILGLSESGVKFHIRNVFTRAKVGSRTELMALLIGN